MYKKRFPALDLELPEWISDVIPADEHQYGSDEEKMRVALTLAQENIRRGGGGPFGAAIFNTETNRLVSVGVNLVVPLRWSGAHAEMVAFAIAQQRVGSHDLGGENMAPMELFSSTEPCAMCLGATFWTGVRRLVCSARGADAEAIGFDEGPKPENWEYELTRRGIAVTRDLMRPEGKAILDEYLALGGIMYNGRNDDAPGSTIDTP